MWRTDSLSAWRRRLRLPPPPGWLWIWMACRLGSWEVSGGQRRRDVCSNALIRKVLEGVWQLSQIYSYVL